MNVIKMEKWNNRIKEIDRAIEKHEKTVANLKQERDYLVKKREGEK